MGLEVWVVPKMLALRQAAIKADRRNNLFIVFASGKDARIKHYENEIVSTSLAYMDELTELSFRVLS